MNLDPQDEIERLTCELAEAKKLLGEGKAQRKLDAAVRQAMQDALHRKNHLIVRSAYPSLCVQVRGGGRSAQWLLRICTGGARHDFGLGAYTAGHGIYAAQKQAHALRESILVDGIQAVKDRRANARKSASVRTDPGCLKDELIKVSPLSQPA